MPLLDSKQATEAAVKNDGIIPDVLDAFEFKTMLAVSYGNNKEVALGNRLSVGETQHPPQVSFEADSPNDKYTLIMTDPDAPSRQNHRMREYRHWIVSNISGTSDFQPASVAQGTEVTPYMGPAPPSGSGPHRYIFLLYKQTPSSDVATLSRPLTTERPKFKTMQFTSHAGLELVGVNYFVAENP
ncbi:phosphatidylethanolamine-binding protein [Dissophora ornata]|nr:hypothetical protein BGZ58_008901 [Dissophora ornata]KAI8603253.1 phosphatidylethanolamine-binding protein [Dissophora ornata]